MPIFLGGGLLEYTLSTKDFKDKEEPRNAQGKKEGRDRRRNLWGRSKREIEGRQLSF